MEKQWNQWVNNTFKDFTWPQFIAAIVAFAAIWGALTLSYQAAKKWLPRWASPLQHGLPELTLKLLEAIKPALFPVYGLCAAMAALPLEPNMHRACSFIAACSLLYQIMLFVNQILDHIFIRSETNQLNGHKITNAKTNLVAGAKVVIWLLAVLLLLDNFGINVSTFVAGLGIGGIAVALAAQAILGDTFGSFTITLDKPFLPGDYIVFGSDEGRVESVGLKTTRIRGLGGEIIVVPNSELTRSRIKNFADMSERRGVIRQSISDKTPLATLEKLPSLMQDAISHIEGIRISRIHLVGTAPQAFVIEMEWYSNGAAYTDFLNRQQAIYLTLSHLMEDAKIAGPAPEKMLLTSESTFSTALH